MRVSEPPRPDRAGRWSAPCPEPLIAARAKIFASGAATKVTNDALQVFGAASSSRNRPLERMVRDDRMPTIGGGTVHILYTIMAAKISTNTGWVFGGRAGGKADELLVFAGRDLRNLSAAARRTARDAPSHFLQT